MEKEKCFTRYGRPVNLMIFGVILVFYTDMCMREDHVMAWFDWLCLFVLYGYCIVYVFRIILNGPERLIIGYDGIRIYKRSFFKMHDSFVAWEDIDKCTIEWKGRHRMCMPAFIVYKKTGETFRKYLTFFYSLYLYRHIVNKYAQDEKFDFQTSLRARLVVWAVMFAIVLIGVGVASLA